MSLGAATCAGTTAAFAVIVLSSCSVGPDYVRPEAPVQTAYREAGEWKPAEPADEAKKGAWWTLFHDETLNALQEQICASNQNIAAAESQYRQARALVLSARAGDFPVVSAAGSVVRGSTGSTTSSTAPTINTYSVSGTASWELDLWGRVRRSVESNVATAQADFALLENTRLSVHSAAAQSYFQIRVLDAQEDMLRQTTAGYAKSLEMAVNRYNSGVVSKADVAQARAQLKSTEAQAVDVGVQRAALEHALAVLLGRTPQDFKVERSPLRATPPEVPLELPSKLVERRPDIAAAERQVAAANAQIGVAKAAYFPVISLGGTGGSRTTIRSLLFELPTRFWSAGPGAAATIFDGGARSAKVTLARAAHEQTVANYRQTVLTAFQEVEDNLAALRVLREEAAIQDEAVQAADESLRLVTNQYKAGVVSYSEVITAQTIALNNRRAQVTLSGARMAATIALIKALGGGWDITKIPDEDKIKE